MRRLVFFYDDLGLGPHQRAAGFFLSPRTAEFSLGLFIFSADLVIFVGASLHGSASKYTRTNE